MSLFEFILMILVIGLQFVAFAALAMRERFATGGAISLRDRALFVTFALGNGLALAYGFAFWYPSIIP